MSTILTSQPSALLGDESARVCRLELDICSFEFYLSEHRAMQRQQMFCEEALRVVA